MILYLVRTITYEIPFIGGRARGKERPRAPSLKERPSGDPRVIGIGVPAATYVEQEDLEEEERRLTGAHTPLPGQEEASEMPEQDSKRSQELADIGFSQAQDDDEDDGTQPQRVFSIGGSDERESWTEVNARRRMGFNTEEGPA